MSHNLHNITCLTMATDGTVVCTMTCVTSKPIHPRECFLYDNKLKA